MPFTLAHPAAALPLRRYCPKLLSFPALVVGTLVPDTAYCFAPLGVDVFSHRFLGSVVFGVPMGWLLLSAVMWLRARVASVRPLRFRPPAPPEGLWRVGSPLSILVSLLIGIWSHGLWDGFTNQRGWFVLHIPALQAGLATIARHEVRVCHFLWYGFSFAGVLWLGLACQGSPGQRSSGEWPRPAKTAWLSAVVVAGLVLPIGVIHHLVHGLVGMGLVAVSTALLVGGFVLQLGLPGRLPTGSAGILAGSLDSRACRQGCRRPR